MLDGDLPISASQEERVHVCKSPAYSHPVVIRNDLQLKFVAKLKHVKYVYAAVFIMCLVILMLIRCLVLYFPVRFL